MGPEWQQWAIQNKLFRWVPAFAVLLLLVLVGRRLSIVSDADFDRGRGPGLDTSAIFQHPSPPCTDVFPVAASIARCSIRRGSGPPNGDAERPPLRVVVLNTHPESAKRTAMVWSWMTDVLLRDLSSIDFYFDGRRNSENRMLSFSRSLTVVSNAAGPTLDFAAYVRGAAAKGHTRIGLLHLHDECQSEGCAWHHQSRDMRKDYYAATVVFRNYYWRPFDRIPHVHYVPLGPKTVCPALPPHLTRTTPCMFAGTLGGKRGYGERSTMAAAVRSGCDVREEASYCETMQRAVSALVPAGNNPECFRLWEAVRLNTLPILRQCADPLKCMPLGPLNTSTAGPPPFILVDSWSEVPKRVADLVGNSSRLLQMEADLHKWFVRYMDDVAGMVARELRVLQDH
jgi:hypothetical protein